VKNLGDGEEDPSLKKAQDDLNLEVILNPSEALWRGVKNLYAKKQSTVCLDTLT
jgi:hypothetical protein